MNFKTHNDSSTIDTDMTCLAGHIQATREDIIRAFGEPSQKDHSEKIKQYWQVQFKNGQVATVYDWRREATPVNGEIYAWHIGARNRATVQLVHDAFRQKNQLQARASVGTFKRPELVSHN